MADKDILEFDQSSKSIIDADSDEENEINNIAPVHTSSKMKNIMKTHSKMSSASKKKTCQYSEEYLKFGFIPAVQDERIPFCLLYQQFLRENLIKPSISAFLKMVLEKDDKDVKAMPLSKNTVSRKIDEMGEHNKKQLVEKLKTRKFSVQMDESTLRDSEAVLSLPRAKCERIFKLFCDEQNEDNVRLLLHTEVRWLSKGNCLKRFMELFDTLSDFLNDKPEMKPLLIIDGKAFFHWLQKCEVADTALLVIVNHLNNLSANFKERFLDLKRIDFPTWMMQPMLVDLSDISNMQYQAELAELQNDDSVKTLFSIKGAMAWLCEETEIKHPNSTKCTRKLLLLFPSSFLAECEFSAVNDLLIKKKKKSAGYNKVGI
ncbi:uncharacterized protein TNCV_4978501 [Trichonephila clavipes]|nr:uncharacterized protein TNCV_4978501 [Trichonephila clavipes]